MYLKNKVLLAWAICLCGKVILTCCEVVWVKRGFQDSFRVGRDGCKYDTNICTNTHATCIKDSGLCLCRVGQPNFRNPSTKSPGKGHDCLSNANMRIGTNPSCALRPFQLIPYRHQNRTANKFSDIDNPTLVMKACSLTNVQAKFSDKAAEMELKWLDKSYVDLNVFDNDLYFKWKKSVPNLQGAIITFNLFCDVHLQVGAHVHQARQGKCFQAKISGTWSAATEPAKKSTQNNPTKISSPTMPVEVSAPTESTQISTQTKPTEISGLTGLTMVSSQAESTKVSITPTESTKISRPIEPKEIPIPTTFTFTRTKAIVTSTKSSPVIPKSTSSVTRTTREPGGSGPCTLRPFQEIPYRYQNKTANKFSDIDNPTLVMKACSLTNVQAKFPDKAGEMELNWLDKSYVDLNVSDNDLYFKWKRSVPGLQGAIITFNLFCEVHIQGVQADQSIQRKCFRAKISGTGSAADDHVTTQTFTPTEPKKISPPTMPVKVFTPTESAKIFTPAKLTEISVITGPTMVSTQAESTKVTKLTEPKEIPIMASTKSSQIIPKSTSSVTGTTGEPGKPQWPAQGGELSNATAKEGVRFLWLCHANGNPDPTYTWIKDGEKLFESDSYEINGGVIRFKSVSVDDAGVYQCVAENEFGDIFSSAVLTVETAPTSPPPDPCTVEKRNLMFLVDGSGSVPVATFKEFKKFMSLLVEKFDIGPNTTHVGVLQYSTKPQTGLEFYFTEHQTLLAVQNAIAKVRYHYGAYTFGGYAMNLAQQIMNHYDRTDAKNVWVLLMDNGLWDKTMARKISRAIRQAGTKVIVLDTENIMHDIADKGLDFSSDNLEENVEEVWKEICK